MRTAALILSVLSLVSIADAQAQEGEACTLLTRELIAQFSPQKHKQSLDLMLSIPPAGLQVSNGSACEYGGVNLQIDPFPAPAQIEKQMQSGWTALSGIGDAAFYRDNRGRWGELYVRTGARVVTLQMNIPTGSTAAAIQPNALGLAKAILSKLK